MMKSLLLFAALALWMARAQPGWSQTTGRNQAEPSGDGRVQSVQPVTPSTPGARAVSPVNPYGWRRLDDQRKQQTSSPPSQTPPYPYRRAPRDQGMMVPGGG
jgi:hypothetical protein